MRILVRAPNWLGDLLMSLPALQAIRAGFAAETLAVAAPPGLAPLLTLVPRVDEIVSLAGSRRRAADVDTLRRGHYDVAILFPNSFGSAWVVRRAGIPERWGYRTNFRGGLLTRSVRRPSRRRARHHADYYAYLTEALGMPLSRESADQRTVAEGDRKAPARLVVPSALRETARAILELAGWNGRGPLIAFAPGAAYGHAKRWPPERFGEVIASLGREQDATAVLVGTASDRDAGQTIESWLASRATSASNVATPVLSLVGRTDLLQLAGVLTHCRACVSNDSGAMHLAAATGIPVVGIFGPTDERVTRPIGPHEILTHSVWCRPCHLRECPIDHRCMKRISVPQVLAATRLALGRSSG